MRFACTSKGTQTLVYSDNQLWQAADVTRSYSKELKLATSNRRLIQREIRNKGKDGNETVMALVVALGSHHIDAGMAGDDIPDIVVPSLVCQVKSFGEQPQLFAGHEAALIPSGTKILPIQKKQITNTKYLLHLIEQVYVSHPCADFEYQPLLLSFSARNMVSDYDELMYECLQRFNIPVIAAVESETLALYTHGQTDGIVVDVGYECTTIVPVEEGQSNISVLYLLLTAHRLRYSCQHDSDPSGRASRDIRTFESHSRTISSTQRLDRGRG